MYTAPADPVVVAFADPAAPAKFISPGSRDMRLKAELPRSCSKGASCGYLLCVSLLRSSVPCRLRILFGSKALLRVRHIVVRATRHVVDAGVTIALDRVAWWAFVLGYRWSTTTATAPGCTRRG